MTGRTFRRCIHLCQPRVSELWPLRPKASIIGTFRTSVSESIPANPSSRRAVGQLQQLVDVALAAMIRGGSYVGDRADAFVELADGDEAHGLALPGEQSRGVVTGH